MSILRQCGSMAGRLMQPQRQLVARGSFGLLPAAFNRVTVPALDYVTPMNSRGHKNFGHKKEITPKFTKVYHLIIGTLFVISITDFKKLKRMIMPKVDADAGVEPADVEKKSRKKDKKAKDTKTVTESDSDSDSDAESENGKDDTIEEKTKSTRSAKEKVGFRERKIIEYENRIRQFSTPDKIFRYFATVRLTTPQGTTVCMTPDDFLRSIYPGMKQPDGLGLDQYRRYDPKQAPGKSVGESLNLNLEKNSIFYKLGSYGLITFSDYIFLLTVLSTSRRHFEIAFQMFDLNGDGDVDCEEFEMVATLVRQQTSIGSRHRDHANTGNTFKGVNSALTTFFFGPNLDKKLTIQKFLDFQHQLQREILSLEFERKHPDENGRITEADFGELLLAYAGYPLKKKQKKLKRVKRRFRDHSIGISKKDYLDFFHFLNNINDVDTALTFYHIAGASIDQATLKHVAKTVAMVELSDHVIDVVFTIFDDNNDNQLSNREFIAVMKNRVQRGLEKPKDTGFIKLMRSMLKCAKETKPVLLDL
ncbi:calcium uptake protein 1 homolog, mitochondrial-like isoform X2 [Musca vetustissima]|uniref:calcium uptake protein 1 homolog, mitochondrial-like isoform X2 n=1 Tax=Musca vetustissima TaxID=27455 RepID=UPI002AB60D72|nr:calcium uptake protein 1 homolog, mitochondrial-like isoform X2 [Musca vetustissima]